MHQKRAILPGSGFCTVPGGLWNLFLTDKSILKTLIFVNAQGDNEIWYQVSGIRYQVSGVGYQGVRFRVAGCRVRRDDGDKKSIFRTVFAICRAFLLGYNE